MRVIQDNRPESNFTFPLQLICKGCHSVLEAQRGDVKKNDADFRESSYFYVTCPLCANSNVVKPNPRREQ